MVNLSNAEILDEAIRLGASAHWRNDNVLCIEWDGLQVEIFIRDDLRSMSLNQFSSAIIGSQIVRLQRRKRIRARVSAGRP